MKSVIGVLFLVSAVVGQGSIDAATLALMDKNSDGFLERSELPGMQQMEDTQWAYMENLVDKNHDGKITIMEYIDFNNEQMAARGNPKKQVEQGFHALDLNHDGNVDQSELPGNLSDKAWKAMLVTSDTDKDGKLSIDEYKAVAEKQLGGGAGGAGDAGGASSQTVTSVLLGLVSTMWLFW